MNHYIAWMEYKEERWLSNMLEQMLLDSGFHIVNKCEHFFDVQGYTGLWLLSESHFAVHSFPEEKKIYLELSSCVDGPFERMKCKLEETFSILEWKT